MLKRSVLCHRAARAMDHGSLSVLACIVLSGMPMFIDIPVFICKYYTRTWGSTAVVDRYNSYNINDTSTLDYGRGLTVIG